MTQARKIVIATACFLSFFVFTGIVRAETGTSTLETLKAPTLIAPNESTVTAKTRPLITGLVKSGANVLFYIDGVFNGKLDNVTHESGTANFAYEPFLDLSVGSHRVWAVAKDKDGNKSAVSNVLDFKIERPMPAPTMFKPVVNSKSTNAQPFIVGLAKNNSTIKVFIDHKLAGQFLVVNHPSGTANFAFKPAQPLARGPHLIYTTATEARGKESKWSNPVSYKAATPAIILGVEEKKEEQKEDNIIPPAEQKSTSTSGLIDESRKNQNRTNGNLIVFILFLVGIIGWIFWVNKELVKEKQENLDKEDRQEKK